MVEEAPTAVKPVPPFPMASIPVTSMEARSIVCPKLVRQVPPTARQPVVTFNPLPVKVEVAVELFKIEPPVMVRPVEVAKNPGATSPVYKVEVGAWKFPMDCTERMEPGVVVPTPTLPPLPSFK